MSHPTRPAHTLKASTADSDCSCTGRSVAAGGRVGCRCDVKWWCVGGVSRFTAMSVGVLPVRLAHRDCFLVWLQCDCPAWCFWCATVVCRTQAGTGVRMDGPVSGLSELWVSHTRLRTARCPAASLKVV